MPMNHSMKNMQHPTTPESDESGQAPDRLDAEVPAKP